MRRPLRARQVRRLRSHHRKARLEQGETLDVEGPGDELGAHAADVLDIIARGTVGRSDDPPQPRIIIALELRIWRERFGDCTYVVELAGELVDDDHRVLLIADTAQFRSHLTSRQRKEGDVSVPLPLNSSPVRTCT